MQLSNGYCFEKLKKKNDHKISVQCWFTTYDIGPTLTLQWLNGSLGGCILCACVLFFSDHIIRNIHFAKIAWRRFTNVQNIVCLELKVILATL